MSKTGKGCRSSDRPAVAVGGARCRTDDVPVCDQRHQHFKSDRAASALHMKPNTAEVMACRFWLEEEIATVRPMVLVALGATAARAVIGPGIRILKDRGTWFPSPLAPNVTVTVHPSSILRAPDEEARAHSHGGLRGGPPSYREAPRTESAVIDVPRLGRAGRRSRGRWGRARREMIAAMGFTLPLCCFRYRAHASGFLVLEQPNQSDTANSHDDRGDEESGPQS